MKSVTGIATFVLGLAAGVVWAQNDDLTPRQIFDYGMKAPDRKPVAKQQTTQVVKPKPPQPPEPPRPSGGTTPDGAGGVTPAAYAPLALRYSILQKKGGGFQEVDADTEFHSGDRIRVRVESNASAYLYIVMGGSSGQWRVLFPAKQIAGGNNLIQKGQPYTIPPETDPPFYFDETAGVEKLSLVLSRTPEEDLEKLIYAAGDPTRGGSQQQLVLAANKPIDGAVVGHMRNEVLSRDLVFEKYDGATPDGTQEKAVYAATRNNNPDARLFVDLKLIHK